MTTLPKVELLHTDLVIFDCDGVLIDSEPLASGTMAKILGDFGVTMTGEQALIEFTGGAASETRARLIEEFGLTDVDTFYATWHDYLFEVFASDLKPMAGIEAVIDAISCPVCVGSNSGVSRLKRSLGLLPMASKFKGHVFSAEMVAEPKPAPDLMLFAAEKLGARPSRSIMIDDSAHGVAAAVAAGMPGIGFIDLNDPRPGRFEALTEAGAFAVVRGAAELPAALRAADAFFASQAE